MVIKAKRLPTIKMAADTYYIWVGGSCDYAHEERAGGGAYIMEKEGEVIERYEVADINTTEFRMMLVSMLHAMGSCPDGSDIVFLTNVSYIQQNFSKTPTDKSANADLITECIEAQKRHTSVSVKIVPYHKHPQLSETHDIAHKAMLELRDRR